MNWFHKILCLYAVIIFTLYCVKAENNEKINVHHGEEESLPPEQILDTSTHDAEIHDNKTSAQLSNTHLNAWNFGHNIALPLGNGLIANPSVGHPLDAQASSPSNNVVLVLANEKNKLAELTKPAEESLQRFVRNPEAINQFSGNVAQRMFQQVAQTAPELSRTFGEALNEVLAQTAALVQTPPGNFNFSQLAPKLSENFDLGQLGQRLSQSFLLGAAPNLLKPQTSPNTKEAEPATPAEPAPGSDAASEATPTLGQQNPLTRNPLFPPLKFGFPPMGIFRPMKFFNPLIPLGSEISEVRVKPDDYNPYKLTPKEVDQQTMSEMRLKALLRDALAKKTIPILWFHLPSSRDVHKSPQDLETEAKLKIFEKQVITELEQLQDLSKLANELKETQLQSGSKPTPSLTTKLNLSEIPIYDITLRDIEKTLEDEHVIMLMHTITQNQNKDFHRHHQANTKYLTDLTGNPIKRQTSSDDVLKTMKKDDMLKMMAYAYRMTAMNGQMPWLKNEELSTSNFKDSGDSTMTNQQRQSMMGNAQMASENQWLEDKQRQMAGEAGKEIKINDEKKPIDSTQTQSMMGNTEMTVERQWLEDKQRQMALEAEKQTKMNNERIPSDNQPNTFTKQWIDPNMSSKMFMQNPTTPPHRPPPTSLQRQILPERPNGRPTDTHPNTFARQWFDYNMPSQMFMQNPTTSLQIPPQISMQRQMPQQMANGRPTDAQSNTFASQWIDQNMPLQMFMQNPPTLPHRPPPASIQRQMEMNNEGRPIATQQNTFSNQWIDRSMPSQMIMQNPATPPHRPPPASIQRQMKMNNEGRPIASQQNTFSNQWIDRSMPSQMIMQNPTTPPHRHPPTNIQRQMGMNNEGKVTDTQPNTFTRQWSDQNMPSQMIMQNPTTPPTTMQRQIPEQMGNGPSWTDFNMPIKSEEKQEMDMKSNSQQTSNEVMQEQLTETTTESGGTNPSLVENTDQARFGGIKNLFEDLNLFHVGKGKGKQIKPTIINYYYNAGGSGYPPIYNGGYQTSSQSTLPNSYGSSQPSYYQAPPYPSKHKSFSNLYGGGGYGSNAYGSYGGNYRAAVGDEEIAVMLQQHQSLPKITMPNYDDPLAATNTTIMENDNADTKTNTKINKRFAKNISDNGNNSPAAYLVVVRNNNSKKSRSKRSTEEFTTLEPIDENSLNALRKTYKNSLKEITLKPNETPAEALMRYKAESVREALEKANREPMELTADAKQNYEGVKESNGMAVQQQDYNQVLPTTSYILNDNAAPQTYMENDAYTAVPVPATIPQSQSLAMAYNQQQSRVVYEPPQDGVYNNYFIKYNSPAVYESNPKILAQNPYLSKYNSLDVAPYLDDYSVGNANAAQIYAIEAANALPKDIQNNYSPTGHVMDYSNFKASEFTNYPSGFPFKKNPYLFTNAISKQPRHLQNGYNSKRFNTLGTPEKLSFENLISVIKEQLAQCCNECNNKILKSLDDSLSSYSSPLPETLHTLTHRSPHEKENFEYKNWLMEMAEKGYDRNYLTNDHQEEYIKDDRLNLHIKTEEGYGQEEQNMFFKNNQSYKRETIEPGMENEAKTEVVIASIKTNNSLEKLTNEAEDNEKDKNENQEEKNQEDDKKMLVEEMQLKENENDKKIKTNPLNLEGNIKIDEDNIKKLEPKQNPNYNIKLMGTTESTNHSVYAMRGQFRAQKQRPMPFSMTQAKRFDNYKNMNKIGKTNIINQKNEDQKNIKEKSDKLEEILILFPKSNSKENTINSINPQVMTTESNAISNAANKSNKIRSRKQSHLSNNRMSTQNSSESSDSLKSIG